MDQHQVGICLQKLHSTSCVENGKANNRMVSMQGKCCVELLGLCGRVSDAGNNERLTYQEWVLLCSGSR
jgi:hypothetical protein